MLTKFWNQHPTKQKLYGHLSPISKIIQIRWTRHARHCWRSKDELKSNILQWTPSHKQAGDEWLARTYLQQLYTDTGCSLEILQEVMDDKDKWWELENPCKFQCKYLYYYECQMYGTISPDLVMMYYCKCQMYHTISPDPAMMYYCECQMYLGISPDLVMIYYCEYQMYLTISLDLILM